MANTTKMPTLPTDKMILAAQYGCGLTTIEAVHVYQTMNAAYEAGDGTAIFDRLVADKTKAIRRAAIYASKVDDDVDGGIIIKHTKSSIPKKTSVRISRGR